MAKFQARKSANPSQTMMTPSNLPAGPTRGTMAANQSNLNTSFSALNSSLSQKWAAINSSGKPKIGGLTGRPTTAGAPGMNLAQTITPGLNNQLNTSNNKFQSKMQSGFASRLQSKAQPASGIPQAATGQIGGGTDRPSPSKIGMGGNLTKSSAGGGISSNSFRSRLVGGLGTNTQAAAGGNAPAGGQPSAASNQDLQKRLADMKAKLQGLKK